MSCGTPAREECSTGWLSPPLSARGSRERLRPDRLPSLLTLVGWSGNPKSRRAVVHGPNVGGYHVVSCRRWPISVGCPSSPARAAKLKCGANVMSVPVNIAPILRAQRSAYCVIPFVTPLPPAEPRRGTERYSRSTAKPTCIILSPLTQGSTRYAI